MCKPNLNYGQSHRPVIAYVLMYLWTESWSSGCLGFDVIVQSNGPVITYMLM